MAKKPKKFYGLSARHVRHAVKEFVDFDYVSKLSEEEKQYLDKFSREFYLASLDQDGTDIHDPEKYSKDIYHQNNARNRDMWNTQWRMPLDHTDTINGNEDDSDE